MANEKRLIWDEDAQHRIVALAVKRQSDYIPLDMITYILFNDTPTVDAVEVVHGRWIYKWDAERDPKKLFVRVVCSACNLHTGQKSNYCPNCGAKMDGDGDG